MEPASRRCDHGGVPLSLLHPQGLSNLQATVASLVPAGQLEKLGRWRLSRRAPAGRDSVSAATEDGTGPSPVVLTTRSRAVCRVGMRGHAYSGQTVRQVPCVQICPPMVFTVQALPTLQSASVLQLPVVVPPRHTGWLLPQCRKVHVLVAEPTHIPPHAPPQGSPQGMPPLAQVGAVVLVVVVVGVVVVVVPNGAQRSVALDTVTVRAPNWSRPATVGSVVFGHLIL